jgi:PilZ domain
VVNLSAEGAAIDVPNAVYIPDRFRLMTENDRVVRDCRVVWIQRNRIGVVFEKESGV